MENKKFWIRPYRPEEYDMNLRIAEKGWIDWHVSKNSTIAEGDILFAYSGRPEQKITHEFVVVKDKVSPEEYWENLRFYKDWKKNFREIEKHSSSPRFIRLKNIRTLTKFDQSKLSLHALCDAGLRGAPQNLQELPDTVVEFIYSVIARDSKYILDDIYEYSKKFSEISIKGIADYDSDKPQRVNLWHYTTISGMRGILENKNFWLSDSKFMNDAEELRHASRIISGNINDKIIKSKNPAITKQFLEDFKNSTKDQRNYIACFCENGDLLSQWRGYGNEVSPVSLEFSISLMMPSGYYLAKVIYDDDLKDDFINGFIGRLDSKYASDIAYGRFDKYQRDLREFLIFAKNIIKHDSFSEEDEWRLGKYALSYGEVFNRLKFRESHFGLTPYIEFNFDNLNSFEFEAGEFELKRIIQGPRHHKSNAEDSLMQYIDKMGYPANIVSSTRIPLRKY